MNSPFNTKIKRCQYGWLITTCFLLSIGAAGVSVVVVLAGVGEGGSGKKDRGVEDSLSRGSEVQI